MDGIIFPDFGQLFSLTSLKYVVMFALVLSLESPVGVMNPETGTDAAGSFNGAGNAFPMMGTGEVVYGQLGYLLRKDLLGKAGTLQPYIAGQGAYFDLLADPMYMYEGGVNWLIEGLRAKVSLNYQSRPVFMANPSGEINFATRRSMVVLQFQIAVCVMLVFELKRRSVNLDKDFLKRKLFGKNFL